MKKKTTTHFIVLFVMEAVEMTLMNTVPLWLAYTQGVILPTWSAMLWAVNVSLIVRMACNLLLVFHRPARLYLFIQSLATAMGLLSIIVFLVVFPINFGAIGAAWLNTLVVVFSVIGLVGGTIGVIVNLVKAIRGSEYESETEKGTPV
jgi:hypothetical protein